MSWFHGRFTTLDKNAVIARHWLVVGLQLRRMLGDYACGLVALEAYFSHNPEITVEYVHNRLDGMLSDDTIRRRLTRMHDLGVLSVRKMGRTLLYRLRPDLADAAVSSMVASHRSSVQPQIAGKFP